MQAGQHIQNRWHAQSEADERRGRPELVARLGNWFGYGDLSP